MMSQRSCICGATTCNHRRPARASTSARGYGAGHQSRRKVLTAMPRPWFCARCGQVIEVGEPWDAGHVLPLGLGTEVKHEHRRCNRSHGARMKIQIQKSNADFFTRRNKTPVRANAGESPA